MKQKLKEFYLENKNLLGILCLFIIVQPFLDVRCFFKNENLQLFGFTIPTIIRCIFMAVLAIFSFKNADKTKNKQYLFFSLYFLMLLIYIVIHHIVVSDDNIVMPASYTYSLFSELFYIIRMLLPLAIIYFTKKSDITYQKFSKTLLISSLIIGFIIVIGNTFCISYTSYETENDFTVLNWISWFFKDLSSYEYKDLTSKGWFYMANQVSGLTMLLLPFCLYDMLKKTGKLNIITSFLLVFAMIMLGTRTASYGWILIYICLLLAIIYLRLFKKETWWNFQRLTPFLCVFFLGLVLLSISPINNRNYGYDLGNIDSIEEVITEKDPIEKRKQYILKNYELFGIQERYVTTLYPVSFDLDFWFDVFELSEKKGVIENREMQTLISQRINELNKNQLKYQLFGYSFSRMRNGGIYMEHDFIVQAYTMGYIGLFLLIGPYILIMCLVSLKIIKKLKSQPKLVSITFMIAICALLGVSIFSGHILDELFVTIYLGFVCGFFWKTVNSGEVKIYEREN